MFIEIVAGSGYGRRYVTYRVADNRLSGIAADSGHDNLAGNAVAAEFDELTLDEVEAKLHRERQANYACEHYDGCHACQFTIRMNEIDNLDHYGEDEIRY